MAATFRTPGRRHAAPTAAESFNTSSPSMIPRAQPGTPTQVTGSEVGSNLSVPTTDSRKRQSKKDEVFPMHGYSDQRQFVANWKASSGRKVSSKRDRRGKNAMHLGRSWHFDRASRSPLSQTRLLQRHHRLWLRNGKIVCWLLTMSSD